MGLRASTSARIFLVHQWTPKSKKVLHAWMAALPDGISACPKIMAPSAGGSIAARNAMAPFRTGCGIIRDMIILSCNVVAVRHNGSNACLNMLADVNYHDDGVLQCSNILRRGISAHNKMAVP